MKEKARLLYFDCSAGVSGDMILGGLLDLGLPLRQLRAELERLPARGFRLKASRARRAGIRGTRVVVEAPGDRGGRRLAEFARLIGKSRLDSAVQERSLALLKTMYEAEARVHGMKVADVHLHEIGSLDTLVDVVGTVVGLDLLGVSGCVASAVNVGGGDIQMEHGRLAAPAPATLELLKGAPTFSDGSAFERTTPTGALLVSGLARFGPWPAMVVRAVGYGLGSKNPSDGRPTALRLVLGEAATRAAGVVLVLETTVDDASPELLGYLLERLLAEGALDVFFTPVSMKKNRPGVNVTVLAPPERREELVGTLFAESTTLGVRCQQAEREMLERRVVEVTTRFGRVPVKLGIRDGEVLNVAPEFEDCRRIASARKVSLKEVQREALAAYHRKPGGAGKDKS
jgi:uncharacterized protein (TIGR00299 family) protein